MYRAVIFVFVYNGSTEEDSQVYTTFSKDIELPFVPVKGLEISVDYDRATSISKVTWYTAEEYFRVDLESRFEESHGMDDVTYEDWIEHFTERQWHNHGEHGIL